MSNPSSLSIRLAALNAEILTLETERTQLLRQELTNAEARKEEIAAFIGVYSASSTLKGSAPLLKKTTKPSSPKKERASNKKTAPTKKPARGKASAGDRLEKAIAIVSKAGSSGISARQLSEETGIPYSAVSKIVKTSGQFRQQGEKRGCRIFLK